MITLNNQEIVFKSYPNGETNIDESTVGIAEGGEINTLVFRYENDGELIHLLILKRLLDAVEAPTDILFTYVPYSRMDRSSGGRAFSLKYIAEFINWLAFEKVFLADPHSDVTPALFDHSVEVSIMDALIERVADEIGFDQYTYFVFPDAGAQKKYERFLGEYHHSDFFVGIKHRNFETGHIDSVGVLCSDSEFDTPPANAKAVIIDDLSSYGGTFVKTSQALKTHFGFQNVYLVVAHAEESIWHGKLHEHVERVFTTDSMPDRTDPMDEFLEPNTHWVIRYPQLELLEETL